MKNIDQKMNHKFSFSIFFHFHLKNKNKQKNILRTLTIRKLRKL